MASDDNSWGLRSFTSSLDSISYFVVSFVALFVLMLLILLVENQSVAQSI
jgi:hypothetical protein